MTLVQLLQLLYSFIALSPWSVASYHTRRRCRCADDAVVCPVIARLGLVAAGRAGPLWAASRAADIRSPLVGAVRCVVHRPPVSHPPFLRMHTK